MASASASVEQVLRAYAERGVIRALDVRARKRNATEFTLQWLADAPVHLVYESRRRLLTLKNLLPHVAKRSALHADLQRFIDERINSALPAHRRIDPAMLGVRWTVERGNASLVVRVRKGDAASAVRRVVNLTHELFVFLQQHWAEYLWHTFGTPTE